MFEYVSVGWVVATLLDDWILSSEETILMETSVHPFRDDRSLTFRRSQVTQAVHIFV